MSKLWKHSIFKSCCLQVMQVVKGLAQGGITVVATIHSPTPATFDLFDRLLLILKGRTVYFGASGEPWPEEEQQEAHVLRLVNLLLKLGLL